MNYNGGNEWHFSLYPPGLKKKKEKSLKKYENTLKTHQISMVKKIMHASLQQHKMILWAPTCLDPNETTALLKIQTGVLT